MKNLFTLLIFTFFCLGQFSISVSAQCTGNITLTTQAQVDAFSCTIFDGDLTIVGTVTDLTPLINLTEVTGSLQIENCSVLTNLDGLQGLMTIGEDLRINDNLSLSSIDFFTNLQTVGDEIRVIENDILTGISTFNNLVSTGNAIVLSRNDLIDEISGFSLLTTSGTITLDLNPSLETISGFSSIVSGPNLNIRFSNSLTSINGFESVQSLPELSIEANSQLTTIDAFSNIMSIGYLIVIDNSVLNCCEIVPLYNALTGPFEEEGNLSDCTTDLPIIASTPPVVTCPVDESVELAAGQTTISVSITVPAVAYDCDLDAYTMTVVDANGNNIVADMPVVVGGTESVSLPEGDNTVTFSATGNNNLTGMCSYTIVVEAPSCLGTITLTSQSQVDAFNCSVFNGTLRIVDDGTDPITDLSALAGLTEVTGRLLIQNNFSLTSLAGLESLTTVGGDFDIADNNALSDLSALDNLVTVVGSFVITDIVSQDISLSSLQSVGGILRMINCDDLLDISGFNALTSVGALSLSFNDALLDISGFQNLTTINDDMLLVNNDAIQDITGFGSVSVVQGEFILWAGFWVNGFPILGQDIDVAGNFNIVFTGLTDLQNLDIINSIGGDLSIRNNSFLSDCCIIPDIPVGGTVILIGNAQGCNAISEINAEFPIITCPTDQTVILDANAGCNAMVTLVHPIPSDDCEVTLTALTIIDPDGNLSFDNFNAGSTEVYQLNMLGDWIFEFSASDDLEQTTTCQTTMTVLDTVGPVFSTVPPNVMIFCNDIVPDAPILTAFDQCDGDISASIMIDESSVFGTCTTGAISEEKTYTYTVNDGAGNTVTTQWVLTIINDFVVDLGPDISGCDINVTLDAGPGDSYLWTTGETTQTITVTGIGTFGVEVTSNNGCCSSDEIVITIGTIPDVSVTDGTLTCTDTSIQLFATSSQSGVSYSWTGPNGYMSSVQDPFVSGPGLYDLTVTGVNGCNAIAVSTVVEDVVEPVVDAVGGILNCNTSDIQLKSTVLASDPVYAWTGPNGFASTEENPIASEVGMYTLVVTGSNGCFSSAQTEVDQDLTEPDLFVVGASLDCYITSAAITAFSTDNNATFQWTGPNFFESSAASPLVSEPGTYFVTVTSLNGCSTSDQVEVIQEINIPDLSVKGGTIDCNNTSVILTSETEADIATYKWTGPNGFISSMENPVISEPGTYNLLVTTVDSCKENLDAIVINDTAVPEVSLSGSMITCVNNTVEILSSTSAIDASFVWSGPNDFTSSDANPMVTESGIYTLEVTTPNGCSGIESITIEEDVTLPTASVESGSLSCAEIEVQIDTELSEDVASFSWEGSDGFTSDDEDPIVITGGEYILNMVGNNGCTNTVTISIEADLEAPNASASGGIIDCGAQSVILMANSTTDDVAYSWAGPGGFSSTEQNPTAENIGLYTLTVKGPNGCIAFAEAEIIENNDIPDLEVSGGTIDCKNEETVLTVNSMATIISYNWTGPNGFVSNEKNPVVTEEGEYILTVEGDNGCINSANTIVFIDIETPDAIALGGTIDCFITEATLSGSSTNMDVTYSWTGPEGYSSNEQNPTVTAPGEYVLTVISSNGCSSSTVAQVIDNAQEPEVMLSLGGANCEDGTRVLSTETNIMDIEVTWTGPNDFLSSELSPAISIAGTYTLQTFPSNGCNSTHSITMDENVNLDANIETQDIVGGSGFGSATIDITSGTGAFIIEWDNGETGETAVNLTEGDHTVLVTDGLGCSQIFDFSIDIINSVQELELSIKMTIFPNPAGEFVNIDLSESEVKVSSIEIINVNGQIIDQIQIQNNKNSITISIDELVAGLYLVRANTAYYTKIEKLIVK